ncbi:MAG: LytTR family DNA-binding domain-containing protein [Microscillaceae bacterium]|jgi:two-component system LytT family response regulator|nr:LytTR family DNA-binding domain-containing protein [Microscillaceae bacterium]
MNVILVDDEESSLAVLSILITQYFPQFCIVGKAHNIFEAEVLIKTQKPDILFLDVQLSEGSGFDLLHNLDKINFPVVFVTAYQQYAIQALRLSAADYLLKPIDKNDLQFAIDKCMKMRGFYAQNELNYAELWANYSQNQVDKILVLNKYSGENLAYSKIISLEADSNYVIIHTTDQRKISLAKTLKEMEEMLCDSSHYFLRVHKSFIINTQHIKQIQSKEPATITLQNNQIVEIPQRKRVEILEILERKV